MLRLSDLMDLDLLHGMIDKRMVSATEHPSGHATILNYTHQAQWSRTWNEVTRQCRGIIINDDAYDPRVVARPFPKFFNVSEHDSEEMEALPSTPFKVYPKFDGSLGILYVDHSGLPAIATRGSFTSEQAAWATERYRRVFGDMLPPEGITLLYEIIYPSNRIVVDYGNLESLTLLAAIDIDTGRDVLSADSQYVWPADAVVSPLDGLSDLDAVRALAEESPDNYENQEGFVLCFEPEDGTGPFVRAKAKFSEYVRLHRIVTGVNAKTIWEYMSTGQSLDELLDRVPDEFYQWVKNTMIGLQLDFDAMESGAFREFASRPVQADRKTLAQLWQKSPYRSLLFRLLDERNIDDLIWKQLKPEATKPFRVDVDA